MIIQKLGNAKITTGCEVASKIKIGGYCGDKIYKLDEEGKNNLPYFYDTNLKSAIAMLGLQRDGIILVTPIAQNNLEFSLLSFSKLKKEETTRLNDIFLKAYGFESSLSF